MSLNTAIEFKKDKKGNITRAIITGAWMYYANLQQARPVFEQRELGKRATKTEWTVDLIVTEDTADEYDSVFNKQSSTKISKADFMKRYKIENEADLPDPKAKKFFMIKVKHAAQNKDGEAIDPRMRPRAVEIVDGKPVDITFDKLIGNGSKGDVLLRVSSNDFGTFSYLSVVKLTDFVEYVGAGSDEVEDEFLGGSLERAEGGNKSSPTPDEYEEYADSAADDDDDEY